MTDKDLGSNRQGDLPTEDAVLALIQRLEAATEDDNEHDLDNAIASWLYENARLCGALVNYDPPLWLIRNGGWINSLDAAFKLANIMLPGQARAVGDMAFDPPGKPWATIWTKGGDPKFNASGVTPALALCIAILKATTASAVGTDERSEVNQNNQVTP